ncbi:helix-turn-helix transcriptional regulator [Paenibacillus hemerocallicola]|uniref:Helix-turn-helix transcriptional regulator n=1 Tax=Paenibacillus hemerocallicola TaxID=1172614 RepID=A0A5C4TAX8_9BACL|nr:helix-turn-helix transcriptional regulator [Paenibacillus hemerocallicola]
MDDNDSQLKGGYALEAHYDHLAAAFVRTLVEVHGAYRTSLGANAYYNGHKKEPTTRCALLFALRGRATFLFNGTRKAVLEPGKALLGGLGMTLEIETGPSGFEYVLIHYLPAENTQPVAFRRMTEVTELHADVDPQMLQMMDRMIGLAGVPGQLELLEKKTLFHLLLGRVLVAERNRQNRESLPMIEQAVDYIHRFYMEPLTLEQIAGSFGMKPKYFSYLFHKYTGISPMNYLIEYRMNRAQEMLQDPSSSVRDIAGCVGYTDAYYFSRLFKKRKGIAPNEVKSGVRGNSPS